MLFHNERNVLLIDVHFEEDVKWTDLFCYSKGFMWKNLVSLISFLLSDLIHFIFNLTRFFTQSISIITSTNDISFKKCYLTKLLLIFENGNKWNIFGSVFSIILSQTIEKNRMVSRIELWFTYIVFDKKSFSLYKPPNDLPDKHNILSKTTQEQGKIKISLLLKLSLSLIGWQLSTWWEEMYPFL
jgi:hypothetical protein